MAKEVCKKPQTKVHKYCEDEGNITLVVHTGSEN